MLFILKNTKDNVLPNFNDIIPKVQKDVLPGEASFGKSKLSEAFPFRHVDLSMVWVKDYTVYFSGTENPMVDLKLVFKDQGKEGFFTVTLAGEVYLSEFQKTNGKYVINDMGRISVDKLPFVIGEPVTITLAYFLQGDKQGVKELNDYCSFREDTICKAYPSLEFGKHPVPEVKVDSLISGLVKVDPSEFAVRIYTKNSLLPTLEP